MSTRVPWEWISVVGVDAFTDRPFAGNPAAVCVLDEPADEQWMRDVAAEMNLSETAFLHPLGERRWSLRWLTPATEVDLCGHATLASAHVLWETGRAVPDTPLRFETRSGELRARSDATEIVLDFPARPAEPCEAPAGLAAALGAPEPEWVGRSRDDYTVVLASDGAVRTLRPDFRALAALPVRGIIVTARSDDRAFDFVSRFFAPGSGVDEDPVTGSAHCTLGPYWMSRLGRAELVGYQASRRGGTVRVLVRGDRVDLRGCAVTVSHAEIIRPLRGG